MQGGIGDITERINNRRGVQPQADKGAKEIDQIAVLGGHAGNDESQTECDAHEAEQDDREEEQIEVRYQMHAPQHEEQVHNHKGSQLDTKPEQFAQAHGDRRYQTRKINLTIEVGIGLECGTDRREAGGEIFPKTDAAEVENRLRNIVGGYIGNAPKDHNINECGEQRRDEVPTHAKDGLLKLNRDVTLDEEP